MNAGEPHGRGAEDAGVLGHIADLVEREHRLRTAREEGALTAAEEVRELAEVEVELDRCWDLLRQRRALRGTGGDPGTAQLRPSSVVEHYLQ